MLFHLHRLSKIIENSGIDSDTNEWVARLTALDNSLVPLISEVRSQTTEIDELLNLYEQAVRLLWYVQWSNLCEL